MTKLVSVTLDLDNPPPLTAGQREELEWLTSQPDEAIDTSDIAPLDERFWANATRFRDRALYRPVKQSTPVRLDADVMAWLRRCRRLTRSRSICRGLGHSCTSRLKHK